MYAYADPLFAMKSSASSYESMILDSSSEDLRASAISWSSYDPLESKIILARMDLSDTHPRARKSITKGIGSFISGMLT